MRVWGILAFTLVTGCSGGTIDRSEAPVNYAAINDAAKGPIVAITLDPIGPEIIAQYDLSDAGCSIASDNGEGLIFIARMEDAHFLLTGELLALVPVRGKEILPYGVSTHYDGLAYSAEISINNDSERVVGPETSDFSGRLIIRDAKERTVFTYAGTIQCGA